MGSAMTVTAALPTFESQLQEIAAAEHTDGWLDACAQADRFLLINRDFVASLAQWLRRPGEPLILEVCAGRGELAEALAAGGVPLAATDADPPAGSAVERASAAEALQRYRPAVVLGCFVPLGAAVDEAVLACPFVRHYVVLGARVGGLLGSSALWRASGWTYRPIPQVARWMLTRHDVWIGLPARPILQHGEAWCFSRSRH